jgi:hypothetical protein
MRYSILLLLFVSFSGFVDAQEVLHQVRISSGDEDADEQSGFVQVYDLELDIGWENQSISKTALFFRNMHLNSNAEVSSITLSLTAESGTSDSIPIAIRIEDNPFPSPIFDTISLVANRSFTNDSVVWIIPPTEKNEKVLSPDLLTLLQPIFDQPAWNASSGIYLLLEPIGEAPDSGNMEFLAFSYDQTELNFRPTLDILVDSNDINGIDDNNPNASTFSVYPNPAFDHLIVYGANNQAITNNFQITDLNGRLMLPKIKVSPGKTRIDISFLAPGIYFLKEEKTNNFTRIIKVSQ